MATTLRDREKHFEERFARDADLAFKISARRNKLLAAWVCEKCGKSEDETAKIAFEYVNLVVENGGAAMEKATFDRTVSDLGTIATAEEIHAKMHEMIEIAEVQLEIP